MDATYAYYRVDGRALVVANRTPASKGRPLDTDPLSVTVVTLCGQVVRPCSMWRMTSAAATIRPIMPGSRLTWRSALKVIFRIAFACSARLGRGLAAS